MPYTFLYKQNRMLIKNLIKIKINKLLIYFNSFEIDFYQKTFICKNTHRRFLNRTVNLKYILSRLQNKEIFYKKLYLQEILLTMFIV